MKKLITLIGTVALCGAAFATNIKYADFLTEGQITGWGLTNSEEVAIANLNPDTILTHQKGIDFIMAHPELAKEMDTEFAKWYGEVQSAATLFFKVNFNLDKCWENALDGTAVGSGSPKLAALYRKNGQNQDPHTYPLADLLACYDEPLFDYGHGYINLANDKILADAARIIKISLRLEGKTFVAKPVLDDEGNPVVYADGNPVMDNPLQKPMEELLACMNAPMYEGLEEWFNTRIALNPELFAKKGIYPIEVARDGLPSGKAFEDFKFDILCDEIPLFQAELTLRKCLGADGYNEFIDLYNNGEKVED